VLARCFLGQPPPVLFPEFFVHGRLTGSYPQTGFAEISSDVSAADFWPENAFALDSPPSSRWLTASPPSQGRRLTVILQSCFFVFLAVESY
jgi:hypothetical protein